MRTTLTLLVLISAVGCAQSFPTFPNIKHHYFVDVERSTCTECRIVSLTPYKLECDKILPLADCNLVGGYKPDDFVKLLNWKEDVEKWRNTVTCKRK